MEQTLSEFSKPTKKIQKHAKKQMKQDGTHVRTAVNANYENHARNIRKQQAAAVKQMKKVLSCICLQSRLPPLH
jgi:hypothetical protein